MARTFFGAMLIGGGVAMEFQLGGIAEKLTPVGMTSHQQGVFALGILLILVGLLALLLPRGGK